MNASLVPALNAQLGTEWRTQHMDINQNFMRDYQLLLSGKVFWSMKLKYSCTNHNQILHPHIYDRGNAGTSYGWGRTKVDLFFQSCKA